MLGRYLDRSLFLQKHNVTWDLSHVPKQITNSDGFRIQLRVNDLISPCASWLSHLYST
jgi:hypothetical protein